MRGPTNDELVDVHVAENVVENNVDYCRFFWHVQLLFHNATNGNDLNFVKAITSAKSTHATTSFNVAIDMAICPTCIIVVQQIKQQA